MGRCAGKRKRRADREEVAEVAGKLKLVTLDSEKRCGGAGEVVTNGACGQAGRKTLLARTTESRKAHCREDALDAELRGGDVLVPERKRRNR